MSTVAPSLPPKQVPQISSDVMLADGSWLSLDGFQERHLLEMQIQQEQKFAHAIRSMPKASKKRALIAGQAYDTISMIESSRHQASGIKPTSYHKRNAQLVLQILNRQISRGFGQPRFFEIGFGRGQMLKHVRDYGFPVGGVEISPRMHSLTTQALGARLAEQLHLGDFPRLQKVAPGRPTVVYWDGVLERVCPDEALDYLSKIYSLLIPGGSLVTISHNRLMRPSDASKDVSSSRTEAQGLHLKEYRLRELVGLLKRAGFRRVAVPLFARSERFYSLSDGGCLMKQLLEPLVDRLPVRLAHFLCHTWGMCCTIATK